MCRVCWVSLFITLVRSQRLISGHSQEKLAENLEQLPYQNIFVPRSCKRLATQNLFTLDIHRRIFRRVKSKMADDLTEIP